MLTHNNHKATILLLGLVFGLLIFGVSQIIIKDNKNRASVPEPTYLVKQNKTEEPFLDEETVIIPTEVSDQDSETLPTSEVLFEYIQIIDSCGPHFENPEECVNVRSGPGTDFLVISRLRNNVVLKVGGQVESEGKIWYKVVFDEYLYYPERVTSDWYVSSDFVNVLHNEGDKSLSATASSTKEILVKINEQKLYAKDREDLFLVTDISTGLASTPTPRGIFYVFKKTPSRYMQGPFPKGAGGQSYDLPGVPWNLYFTKGGAVIHGTYWHDSFGSTYSHGCVNIDPATARKLYDWADLGTKVIVE
jgi:hypothetical protein